jgi:hypothetical protein
MKPQRQVQQKGVVLVQQWQILGGFCRLPDRRPVWVRLSLIVSCWSGQVLSFEVVDATIRPTRQSVNN